MRRVLRSNFFSPRVSSTAALFSNCFVLCFCIPCCPSRVSCGPPQYSSFGFYPERKSCISFAPSPLACRAELRRRCGRCGRCVVCPVDARRSARVMRSPESGTDDPALSGQNRPIQKRVTDDEMARDGDGIEGTRGQGGPMRVQCSHGSAKYRRALRTALFDPLCEGTFPGPHECPLPYSVWKL